MNIAVLFNSDHPKYNYVYGTKIRDQILSTNVLQASNRNLRISVGDVLIPLNAQRSQIESNLYFWHPWRKFHEDKLRATYLSQTVYAWVIQNITADIADQLHLTLSSDEAYLGLHQVSFAHPFHLALYRNSMCPMFRIIGNRCNVFYSMGNEDEKSDSELEYLKKFNFSIVGWEDNGARQTIFDNFDTVEHFKKVEEFITTITPNLNADSAGELAMLIEEINPKLFNALGAAVKALSTASNEEEYAQVGLSARRYFEQLADVLFPPQKDLYNGRKVTAAEYKNRIWAYIADSFDNNDPERDEKIKTIGKELDRIVVEVNAVLHSSQDKERVMNGFIDSAKLSIVLLNLRPEKAKDPYYAFNDNLKKFFDEIILKKQNN